MNEIAICEVCNRTFFKSAMQGAHANICVNCAKPLPKPPKVDFWALADDDGVKARLITCKDCGAQFWGKGCAKFCGSCRSRREKECQARQRARKKEAKRTNAPPDQKVCAQCGAPLPSIRHKYCEDCARKRYDARMAEWRKTHRQEINAAQRAKYHARKAKEAKQ